MEKITKLQIIEALSEKTIMLSERKSVLIDKLFEVQIAAGEEIKKLCQHGFIDPESWGVSWLKLRYNDYMMYDGMMIEYSTGGYDGGDFNSPKPPTCYPKLIEFVSLSTEIIESMQRELDEKLNKIEQTLEDNGTQS